MKGHRHGHAAERIVVDYSSECPGSLQGISRRLSHRNGELRSSIQNTVPDRLFAAAMLVCSVPDRRNSIVQKAGIFDIHKRQFISNTLQQNIT